MYGIPLPAVSSTRCDTPPCSFAHSFRLAAVMARPRRPHFHSYLSLHASCPTIPANPSMTGANMNLVTVEIDLPPNAPPPQPKPDEGEHIVQRLVPLRDLDAVLRGELPCPLTPLEP